MLTFFAYTVLFIFGTACFVRVLHRSIQHGEWLDRLLGWQAMLDRLYSSKKQWKKDLAKPLGDCVFCFSHAVSFISFWFYLLFAKTVLHYWVTAPVENIALKVIINIGWYILFGSIGTIISTLWLTTSSASKHSGQ